MAVARQELAGCVEYVPVFVSAAGADIYPVSWQRSASSITCSMEARRRNAVHCAFDPCLTGKSLLSREVYVSLTVHGLRH